MVYSLSNCEWKVKGYYPWVPLKDRSMETGKELLGITEWLKATVPGGIHYDLYRAGLISDPYKDMDSFKCEWVENRWWLYKTVVHSKVIQGKYQSLIFKGIDYKAIIYVNGMEKCRHEGMFEPITLDISNEAASGEDIELKVLILHAPDEMGQIGKTSQTFTQKSRFNYKWDFSTRLVNLGIWDDCYIRFEDEALLEEPCIYSDYQDSKGFISFEVKISERYSGQGKYEAEAILEKDGIKIQQVFPVLAKRVTGSFVVENPLLWYPNGYGSQELYKLKLTLKKNNRVLDNYEAEIGIRSVQYRNNEGSPENALPYTFCINEVPVYIKGVNMTPLDHIYGNVSDSHYEHLIKMMKNMNVNMVRVWGGGVIEKDVFYRLCDQYGILVWQEFIQSSSGIDNTPSKRPVFLNLLKRTAESALRRIRSHTSLTVWSGGNELTDNDFVPAGYEDENIAMLKKLVESMDPQRLFLPTSASGPNEFINKEEGVSHDIHGNWNYMGNPEHYELYAGSDSLFHSEFGTEGMCSVRSLEKFLSDEYRNLLPAEDNMAYRHHGEWWCTYKRDQDIFGERNNMEQMSKCSQWLQAEGLRYILEANRRRKFHNSGSIIWQINEPWPNVYCTSLIDYYMEPKMAYYWSKTVFSDLTVSMDYRKLDYQPGELFQGTVYVGKEQPEADMEYLLTCEVIDLKGRSILQKEQAGKADCTKTLKAMNLQFRLPQIQDEMFIVRLRVKMNQQSSENLYFFGCGDGMPYEAAMGMEKGELVVKQQNENDGVIKAEIRNTGNTPVLHIHPYCEESYDLLCDRSYFTLFPNESAEIKVQYTAKSESGFLNHQVKENNGIPNIKMDYFNR
ncbi:glycoside hydrolase family 2 protein [Robinsoniella peoriensis]|uniref:glycoside hydrolase family 2 protein n=1 Tax=Robinsoniella peoriensis TaxID=180332 RepID=UPI0005C7D008|nr:glycoside hydrolase family 2 TIM barrel-domain containing protein [Robinsoniella peoriensis]